MRVRQSVRRGKIVGRGAAPNGRGHTRTQKTLQARGFGGRPGGPGPCPGGPGIHGGDLDGVADARARPHVRQLGARGRAAPGRRQGGWFGLRRAPGGSRGTLLQTHRHWGQRLASPCPASNPSLGRDEPKHALVGRPHRPQALRHRAGRRDQVDLAPTPQARHHARPAAGGQGVQKLDEARPRSSVTGRRRHQPPHRPRAGRGSGKDRP